MTEQINKTVLIVDDDRVFLDSLEQFLLQRGYHCKVAGDADSALRIVRDFSLDVVVADIVMPGKDGIQLMQEAKARKPELDFIFMTGYSYDHSYVEIINAGAADYITKPFEMMELIARIERIEREKRLVRELKDTNAQLQETVEQVNRMMDEVRQTARAKSNLLADISHEIRTPLTGILGFADILLATDIDEEQYNYARNIRMSGEVILSLINDFLDSAKVEAGKMQLEEIAFDPVSVCYDVCDLIRPRLYGKPVELLCRVADQVPAQLMGDPHRFRQVLLNLMSNAAKFTETGEIEISLETKKAAEADGQVAVHVGVRDTGIGLSPDNMAVIFEPFRQSHDSVSRKYGGTGLGLFLCKKIAEMMGGDIFVDSQPETGSYFEFVSTMKSVEEAKDGEGEEDNELGGRKVFLAIPNQTGLEIVSQILKNRGMTVIDKNDCREAFQIFRRAADEGKPFDLAVVDAVLFAENPHDCEFVSQITDPAASPGPVPVVALTEPLAGSTRKCENLGCHSFLPKPVRRETLLKVIQKLVGQDAGERQEATRGAAEPLPAGKPSEGAKPATVLLAEDNPVNQKLVAAMLKKAGYDVVVAPDGKVAVERYKEDPQAFSVILMDVQMPEMDGISATKAVRQWESRGNEGGNPHPSLHIPIIAVTAGAVEDQQKSYFDAGMDDLLLKPIRRAPLFAIVEKWTDQ